MQTMPRPAPRGNVLGFTLVELLVVIGIIGVLISILLPALARVRGQAATVQCAANLRVIGQVVTMYVNESKGAKGRIGILPAMDRTWQGAASTWNYNQPLKFEFQPYIGKLQQGVENKIMYCPVLGTLLTNYRGVPDFVDSGTNKPLYAYNPWLENSWGWAGYPERPASTMKQPSSLVIFADGANNKLYDFVSSSYEPDPTNTFFNYRHAGFVCNVLFLDAHVAAFKDTTPRRLPCPLPSRNEARLWVGIDTP